MPAPSKLSSILGELSTIDDREMKSDMLIEFADQFREVPPEIAKRPYPESHRAPACESEAYVWIEKNGPHFTPYFAVENPQGISAKALAAILVEGVSGATADEILAVPEDMVYQIFGQSLSMGKGQGLLGMIGLLKGLVRSYPV
jgi:cysteine desulfuration protein SufE